MQLPTDFRTIANQHAHPLTAKTLAAIRRAERVQEIAISLASEMGVSLTPTLPTLSATDDPEHAAAALRSALEKAAPKGKPWRDKQTAYVGWRERAEGLGVFVIQATLDRRECRAFSLASSLAPLVLVNSVEFPAARSFSLIHELAHLSLHASALCDMLEPDPSTYPASAIEVFCNHVAGAVLVPSKLLLARPELSRSTRSWTDAELESMASPFKVSKEVLLRRLLIHGLTTQSYYESRRKAWERQHKDAKQFIPRVPQSKKPLNRNGLSFSTT